MQRYYFPQEVIPLNDQNALCLTGEETRRDTQPHSRNNTETMRSSESCSTKPNANSRITEKTQKPPFRPAKDDTKPVLQDPILRSDPIETEEAVLRLPPFSVTTSTSTSKMA